ncbi:MAG: transposase DNA-binding-containing protein [Phyllobacterium sp.]|uniref:IS4/Tn5 family transposase DNA-binding protein n=1 Tax=Phyllobacterium sp. TaxID=1871046 RepID=UPI0030F0D8EB
MVDNEGHWSKQAIDVRSFKDARLGRRCTELLRQLGEHMGGSIPFASQDWANTKAAYRFFSNPNVEEGDILNGHFAATAQCYDASSGPILVLQDTTEFTYQRRNPRPTTRKHSRLAGPQAADQYSPRNRNRRDA